MEKHSVKISILTTVDDKSHAVELKSRGTLTRDKGSYIVEYEDLSFLGVLQTHSIAVSDNLVTINREGAINSTMVFEKGKSYYGNIETPIGELPIHLFSHVVKSSFEKDSLCVNLKYTIEVDGNETLNDLMLKAVLVN